MSARRFARLRAGLLAVVAAGIAPHVAGFAVLDYNLPAGTFVMQLELQKDPPSKSADWNKVAQDCLTEWNRHLTGTKFSWVANSTAPKAARNGKNNVFWGHDIYGESFDPRVLGVTLTWTSTTDETVVAETDTIFNASLADGWDAYRGALKGKGPMDFTRVALHEFGHSLGLDHPDEDNQTVEAVMNSTVSDTATLTPDDIAGADYLDGAKSAPVITQQPADCHLPYGSQAQFSATISGRAPLSISWIRDGVPVQEPGYCPPSPNGTITYYSQATPGSVALVVSNAYGTVRSRTAQIVPTTGFTQVPADQSVLQGSSVVFAVTMAGNAAVKYQWFRPGPYNVAAKIKGATKSSLTLTNVQPADATVYTIEATSGGVTYSADVTLRLKLGASVTPTSRVVDDGSAVTLSAVTEGRPLLTTPDQLTIDAKGNLYFTDQALRKITPTGTITTLSPFDHDGGIACDSSGNLYLAGNAAGSIVRLDPTGKETLVAGFANGNVDGRAAWARFGVIRGMAVAADGSIYIADWSNHSVRKLSPTGKVTTLAGGAEGVARVDGKGAAAGFDTLQAIAIGSDKNIYVIDRSAGGDGAHLIRKITPAGVVTTLAGGAGKSGQPVDGNGRAARFATPWAIAADKKGNLYVADGGTVRKIAPGGVVTTFAGSALTGQSPDPRLQPVPFVDLRGIAVGLDGSVYVADHGDQVIQKIDPSGTVAVVAGVPRAWGRVDGNTAFSYQWKFHGRSLPGATGATLTLPHVHAADIGDYTVTISNSAGKVTSAPAAVDIRPAFVVRPTSQIKMGGNDATLTAEVVSPSGRPLTYQWSSFGTPIAGATGPTLHFPDVAKAVGSYTLAVSDGKYTIVSAPVDVKVALAIVDPPKGTVRPDGSSISLSVYTQNALEPSFNNPGHLVCDAQGSFLVVDQGGTVIRKISPDGGTTTFAGAPWKDSEAHTAIDGTGSAARFVGIVAMIGDSTGNLLVIDGAGIRKVTPAGVVTTVAGSVSKSGQTDGPGLSARFDFPVSLASDPDGNIYVGESSSGRIRKIGKSGAVTTVTTGLPAGVSALVRRADGTLVAFTSRGVAYTVSPGGAISAYAGVPNVFDLRDGPLAQATFGRIAAAACDEVGNLYALDSTHDALRKISPAGIVSTVAPRVIGESANLLAPTGFCLGRDGRLYVSDTFSQTILRIAPDGKAWQWVGSGIAGYQEGPSTSYQWLLNGLAISGATEWHYTIDNLQRPAAGNYTVVVSNSLGSLTSAVATVGDEPAAPTATDFDSSTRTLAPGAALALTVDAHGTDPLSYQWMKNGLPIEGASAKAFSIPKVSAADAGFYSVAVSNMVGRTTIGPVAVNVSSLLSDAPAIQNPAGASAATLGSGYPLAISVGKPATLVGELSYQWIKDGLVLPGQTGSALNIPHLRVTDRGAYTVRIAGSNGSIVSDAFVLTVPTPIAPAFQTATSAVHAMAGEPVTLSSPLLPNDALITYQWLRNGVAIPGANSATLAFSPVTQANDASYSLRAVTDGGASTSIVDLVVAPASPRISYVLASRLTKDTWSKEMPFTISDFDTPLSDLVVTARSLDPTLVPTANIKLSGAGANRTIQLKGAYHAFGECAIVVSVSDGQTTTNSTFFADIVDVNEAPLIGPIPHQTIKVNGTTGVIKFPLSDDGPHIAVSAQSSDSQLIPPANISTDWIAASNTGTIAIRAAAGRTGTAVITLTASDGHLSSTSKFSVTVTNVNHAPTIGAIANQAIGEDKSTAAIPFKIADADTSAAYLNLSATSSNTKLLPTSGIVFGGSGANRTVKLTPAANQNGTAKVTVKVSDGALSATRAFTLTVKAVNDAPTITAIANQTINEDASTAALAFKISDVETPATSLKLSASCSNPTLLPAAGIVLGGSGANRTIKLTPAANQNGTATITIKVSDGALSATRAFTLTVKAVNDTPTLTTIANQTVNEDTSTAALAFKIGDVETPASSLKVTATSSNSTLFPAAGIALGGSGANRTIKLTPAANQNGSATLTIKVSDGALTASGAFTVTVKPVNDAPTISAIADQTTNLNTPTPAIAFTVGDVDTTLTAVTVTGSSSNPTLLPTTGIGLSGASANRTVRLTPAPDQSGVATVTLRVSDGSLSANRSFTLTVRPLPSVTISSAHRQVVTPGDPLALQVSAAGTGSLTYQWFHNGRPLPDATGAAFARLAVTAADAGYYWVDVTDSVGTRRSGPLFVLCAPATTAIVGWGDDSVHQLDAPALTSAIALAAGERHALALTADGSVHFWGATVNNSDTVPSGLDNVVAIAAGKDFSLALRADGSLVSWGTWPGSAAVSANTIPFVAIAAGSTHALGLGLDGQVLGFGSDTSGRISIPPGLGHVTAISAGATHSLALRSDGTVVAWGCNDAGQTSVPAGLSDVVAIAAGGDSSLALKSDGTVVSWGAASAPENLTDVVALNAGFAHALALRSDGSVRAWGQDIAGETTVTPGLDEVFNIAAGDGFSLALRDATADAAPAFTTSPVDQSAAVGGSVTFSVAVSGHPGVAYCWQRSTDGGSSWADLSDDAVYTGTATSVLTIDNPSLEMDGSRFRCLASNSVQADVASSTASLSVTPAP